MGAKYIYTFVGNDQPDCPHLLQCCGAAMHLGTQLDTVQFRTTDFEQHFPPDDLSQRLDEMRPGEAVGLYYTDTLIFVICRRAKNHWELEIGEEVRNLPIPEQTTLLNMRELWNSLRTNALFAVTGEEITLSDEQVDMILNGVLDPLTSIGCSHQAFMSERIPQRGDFQGWKHIDGSLYKSKSDYFSNYYSPEMK